MAKKNDIVGWRERVYLPAFSSRSVIAKLDTGAKTCALHAENITYFRRNQQNWVRFDYSATSSSKKRRVECVLLGKKKVRSSVGVETLRPVIRTQLMIGSKSFDVEITLVNRDIMGHRLLIGRTALALGFLVDSSQTFLLKKRK
jgi:hypothetical protein